MQQFMFEYPDVVDKAYLDKYGDDSLASIQKINLRYDVAKALFVERYSHLTAELEEKADEQLNEELDQWNLVMEDISSAENVSEYGPSPFFLSSVTYTYVFSIRDTLFDAVHPLLQFIGTYADCHVSLIVGNAGTGESEKEFFTA